jgi:vacuolar-type H+-ATPase subunit H
MYIKKKKSNHHNIRSVETKPRQRGCYYMSLEVVKSISEAEETARQAKAAAQLGAKAAIAETEKTGQKTVTEAISRAEEEVNNLFRTADEKAAEHALALKSSTSNRQAAIQAAAGSKLDQAALLIVERIVKS